MEPKKIKHLDYIQNIITRMNTNSFQIKIWTITIVAAILALYANSGNSCFILIGIIPTFIFWFLDSYYLMMERKFRGLYNDIAGISKNPKEIKPFEMRPDLYKGGKYCYWNVFLSVTILLLYSLIILLLIILFFILKGL